MKNSSVQTCLIVHKTKTGEETLTVSGCVHVTSNSVDGTQYVYMCDKEREKGKNGKKEINLKMELCVCVSCISVCHRMHLWTILKSFAFRNRVAAALFSLSAHLSLSSNRP